MRLDVLSATAQNIEVVEVVGDIVDSCRLTIDSDFHFQLGGRRSAEYAHEGIYGTRKLYLSGLWNPITAIENVGVGNEYRNVHGRLQRRPHPQRRVIDSDDDDDLDLVAIHVAN